MQTKTLPAKYNKLFKKWPKNKQKRTRWSQAYSTCILSTHQTSRGMSFEELKAALKSYDIKLGESSIKAKMDKYDED